MDGFVIVSLILNNTYNGSEASLKASEINNTYLVRASDFRGSEQWTELTANDPNYTPFYGLWAYLLFASVLFIPALTWPVLYIWKLHVDRKNDAQENQRDPEADPVPVPVPHRDASIAEMAVVGGFLLVWRLIGLAIPFQRIVFAAKLLPWLRAPELGECMDGRLGTFGSPESWAWGIIVPGAWVVFFDAILMVFRIWTAIATLRRRRVWVIDQFDKENQLTCLWLKIIFGATVMIVFFAFGMQSNSFSFCANAERRQDLHMLMISYVPGAVWMVIDRLSRPILRYYLPACGFPRFPPASRDVLGLEGPEGWEQPANTGNA
ncbi:hypothetical protein PG996_012850 [Apiospora saccharicola]|uniref:Uncharacterized protein n=1 Tax=Apiospora saccharicola TaxID=335842 RepID=A0ABR1U3S2_9PEZI